MNPIKTAIVAALVAAVASLAVVAGDNKKESTAAAMTAGEVKKVDKDAGKVTIKHGPLANLDMPAMTMVFRVQDAVMLDELKPGDKINFAADKIKGAYTVTKVEKAK